MNNLDHISESLKTIFWVKILKFFVADPGIRDGKNSSPGYGMEKIRIRVGLRIRILINFGSWIWIRIRVKSWIQIRIRIEVKIKKL